MATGIPRPAPSTSSDRCTTVPAGEKENIPTLILRSHAGASGYPLRFWWRDRLAFWYWVRARDVSTATRRVSRRRERDRDAVVWYLVLEGGIVKIGMTISYPLLSIEIRAGYLVVETYEKARPEPHMQDKPAIGSDGTHQPRLR